jgi:DNA-binding NarL/FixJ family response regulator
MIPPDAPARHFDLDQGPEGSLTVSANQPPTLRSTAMAADASATTNLDPSLLWRELVSGNSRVIDGFFSAERCYLVVASVPAAHAVAMDDRRKEILEAVLGGVLQKNIAIEMRLAPSTVALNSRLALRSLGVSSKPSRAHPLLMFAAKAVIRAPLALARCAKFSAPDGCELRVIGAPRPDRELSSALPRAELAVIRALVEGLSYVEIARQRGTSTRTIANQITAVFRRLRVSGRNELVQSLFFGDAPPRQLTETLCPPKPTRPSAVAHGEDTRRSA